MRSEPNPTVSQRSNLCGPEGGRPPVGSPPDPTVSSCSGGGSRLASLRQDPPSWCVARGRHPGRSRSGGPCDHQGSVTVPTVGERTGPDGGRTVQLEAGRSQLITRRRYRAGDQNGPARWWSPRLARVERERSRRTGSSVVTAPRRPLGPPQLGGVRPANGSRGKDAPGSAAQWCTWLPAVRVRRQQGP